MIIKQIKQWLSHVFKHEYVLNMLLVVFMATLSLMIISANQGYEPNRLDELSNQVDNKAFSYALIFISAHMGSPSAQIKLGKHDLIEGDYKSAQRLLFQATWKVPSLGLKAGKLMLAYADNDRERNLAADYLTRAALLSDNAEADLLLGYLSLGQKHQILCSTWKQAFHWFERGAEHGDGISKLIVAYTYGIGLGVEKSERKSLGFLLVAENNVDKQVSMIAKKELDTFAFLFLPNSEELLTTRWNPYPSESTYRRWLVDTLESHLPDADIFQLGYPQALPGFCPSEDIRDNCDPYKEAC